MSLADRWNRAWFGPAPVLDLAIVRLLVVGLHQVLLLWPYALMTVPLYEEFDHAVALPDAQFEPVLLFRLFSLPFGAGWRPSVELLDAVRLGTTLVGFTALVGLFTRTSLALYVTGFAFMISHRYSFGDYHHVETVPVLVLALLACSPSGAALSVDARLRRRRAGSPPPLLERTDPLARWPVRLAAWLLSVIYLSAGLCKLGGAGLDWMNGFTVQTSLLQAGCFWDNGAGLALARYHGLAVALTWFTMLFELTFPVILWRPALAPLYALAAFAFHVGSMTTMSVPFALYLPCFAILVPWTRWLRRRRGLPADVVPATASAPSSGASSS